MKIGHEFTVTTEDKYAKDCDDKVLYVDYVRPFIRSFYSLSVILCNTEKFAEGNCSGQADLRR